MSTTVSETTADHPGLANERPRRRMHWVVAVAMALVAVAVSVALANPFALAPSARTPGNADPTGLYTLARQPLSSQTQVAATLGYAGSYSVVNQTQGTLTSLPSVGQVVSQGQVVYQVSGAPVALLYGSTPAYRTLSSGLTGADVAQLNTDLLSLGDATTAEIPAGSDTFTSATATALKKLQAALDATQNGTLTLGQAVFLPGVVRVTTVSGQLGGPAPAGQTIIQGTSTTRQVSIALDAAQQSEVKVGDKVAISLPNNQTTPGVISSVGTVAITPPSVQGGSTPSAPTITVLVTPTDSAATGGLDQAPVNVTITTGTVSNVLVVPVDALLAQPSGGYGVEIADADDIHRLVRVTLGLFDNADGLVQIAGSGLAAGQRVVVPAL